jgi:uncharacterized membrane protein YbhN (UPF0104 family)
MVDTNDAPGQSHGPPREPVAALSPTARRLASGPGTEGPSGREETPRRLRLPQVGRRVATIGLLAVLGVALLAAVPGLRGVLREIGDIGLGWVALAVALELASSASFVVVFRLFFDSLEARDARALAWTTQASGVLLPGGGAGGLAINGWLVRLTGAPVRWIARRSAALFFLGGAVSSAALVGAGLALIAGAPGPHGLLTVILPTVIAALGTFLIGALPAILRSWPRAPRWLASIGVGVREGEQMTFRRRPNWRLLGALGYLAFDVAVLWVILRAVGSTPSIAALILGYSIGYAANWVPIPGGIGVLDAGLTGALVLYGVSPGRAAAAVIVYHAIAFWVPGIGGVLAYLRVRPRLMRAGADTPGDVQPPIKILASEEACHVRTHGDAQTDPSWLGRGAQRRSRARPLSWVVR